MDWRKLIVNLRKNWHKIKLGVTGIHINIIELIDRYGLVDSRICEHRVDELVLKEIQDYIDYLEWRDRFYPESFQEKK